MTHTGVFDLLGTGECEVRDAELAALLALPVGGDLDARPPTPQIAFKTFS
jgi:hypothetical protein